MKLSNLRRLHQLYQHGGGSMMVITGQSGWNSVDGLSPNSSTTVRQLKFAHSWVFQLNGPNHISNLVLECRLMIKFWNGPKWNKPRPQPY